MVLASGEDRRRKIRYRVDLRLGLPLGAFFWGCGGSIAPIKVGKSFGGDAVADFVLEADAEVDHPSQGGAAS